MLTTPDHTDAATAVPAMEPVGPRPAGFWLDCDPATGQPGTRFRAEEFNELALNLRAFLTAAGVLPVKGSPTMLLSAMNRLFAGAVTAIVATSTLTADNAGLVIIDATAGDVTLTLPDASVLPQGSPAFTFVRLDATAHRIRIVPVSGDVIRNGVVYLETDPAVLRSDGASTWWPLTRMGAPIARAVTLNVTPAGVANPADPMGGDAFNDLGAALAWLSARAITQNGSVTIAIAAGTYTRTTGIGFDHPNGDRITVAGAGSASTILQFNASYGLWINGDLGYLQKLTIRGDGTAGAVYGLTVTAGHALSIGDDVRVDHFGGVGVYVVGAVTLGATTSAAPVPSLTVLNCLDWGVRVGQGGQLTVWGYGQILLLNNVNGLLVQDGSTARLAEAAVQGGARGVWITDGGSCLAGNLGVFDVTDPAHAVFVDNGGFLGVEIYAPTPGWQARNSASTVWYAFNASDMGRIDARDQMNATNKPLTSPAINTFGNHQGYIVTW